MSADPPPAAVLVVSKDEDPSIMGRAVQAAVGELLGDEDPALAVEDLSGDDLTVSAVIDACQTPPLLTGRRVVVVRDVGRWSTEEAEPLIAYLADPSPTTALVLVGGGARVSQRLSNAVAKHGTVVDASVPGGRGRTSWLVEQIRSGPVDLDAAAASRLGEHLGEDVGRLAGVLEALAARYGEGARVDVERLEPFLGEAGSVAPWDLTDAIDRGDTAGALTALRRLMGAGERHPMGVLAVLHRHYGAVLRLDGAGVSSDAEAAALVGMAPFPAGKALRTARRLGSAGVARAITLLADADLDLRGARDLPDELVMEVLVARLSRLGPRPSARARSGPSGAAPAGRRRPQPR